MDPSVSNGEMTGEMATILAEFEKLTREQQVFLAGRMHDVLARVARRALLVGSQVAFKTKHGVEIKGTLEKVNHKSCIVRSNTDRYGVQSAIAVRWTVSPELVYEAK